MALNLTILAEINAERAARGEPELTVAEMTARLARNAAMKVAADARHEARLASDATYRAKWEAAGKAGAAFAASLQARKAAAVAPRMVRLAKPGTKHLYQLTVRCGAGADHQSVEVEANTHTQAGSIARKMGWEVCDVNMVG